MIKAFFLDFYGTVVHEDGEVVKKISQLIYNWKSRESIRSRLFLVEGFSEFI